MQVKMSQKSLPQIVNINIGEEKVAPFLGPLNKDNKKTRHLYPYAPNYLEIVLHY